MIDPRTVKKASLQGFKNVDPIWTTPLMYNALDPSRPDFYKPTSWWVMGQHWDATRMIIMVSREVPDIFKPGFNFSGIESFAACRALCEQLAAHSPKRVGPGQ